MSRLLFAAARGARIEGEWQDAWEPADLNIICGAEFYRIHPDDAHLAYGPISTALREFAETGKTQYTLSALMAMTAYNHEKEYPFVLRSERRHASMFALILAEALAEEGL